MNAHAISCVVVPQMELGVWIVWFWGGGVGDWFTKSNNSNDVLLMFEPLCTLIHSFWTLNFWIMTM